MLLRLKNRLLAFLRRLWGSFERNLLSYIVASTGLSGIVAAKLKLLGHTAYELMTWQTDTYVLLLLCPLFYLLGMFNERSRWIPKNQPISVTNEDLIQVGNFCWKITTYTDNSFHIDEIPYCIRHDTRLVEYWPLYACPVGDSCHHVSQSDLKVLRQQARSIIEADLREFRAANA